MRAMVVVCVVVDDDVNVWSGAGVVDERGRKAGGRG